ncbi:MAG: serine protease [Gemmataceae bacterium]|nr:serine protease [Gemmataceae bacterium]
MKRLFLLSTTFILFWSHTVQSQDPALATVRIKSHGASATVIASAPGRSWLLGCGHMLADAAGRLDESLVKKPLALDGPPQPRASKPHAAARLRAFNLELDLCLIELDNGPFHFVPVAARGHAPSKNLRSLGYDNMAWPVTSVPVSLLFSEGNTTFTREKPWHGRSGGGLIDLAGPCLIGVVQGYEIWPNQRGLYVSHEAVLRFLEPHWPDAPRAPPPAAPFQ